MHATEELLLQKALFDELTPEESSRFEALCQADPSLRRRLAGLQGTAALAAGMPRELPSRELQARIVGVLEARRAADAGRVSLLEGLAQRCPYYFFLVGALHLFLGMALQSLLQGPQTVSAPGWVLWQPDFALAAGFFFLACGGLLLLRVPYAVRISYGGVLCYIAFVAVNGMALQFQIPVPRLSFGLFAFAGMGLSMGVLLGALLQHYSKDMGHGHARQ